MLEQQLSEEGKGHEAQAKGVDARESRLPLPPQMTTTPRRRLRFLHERCLLLLQLMILHHR